MGSIRAINGGGSEVGAEAAAERGAAGLFEAAGKL